MGEVEPTGGGLTSALQQAIIQEAFIPVESGCTLSNAASGRNRGLFLLEKNMKRIMDFVRVDYDEENETVTLETMGEDEYVCPIVTISARQLIEITDKIKNELDIKAIAGISKGIKK